MVKKIFALFKSMLKFGTVSLVATGVDILCFLYIFVPILPEFYAELCSGFIGMTVNFFMQKKFVFKLQRKQWVAFAMSIGFSFLLLFFGAFAIDSLAETTLFAERLLILKLIVVGTKFCINYFSKKWIFEKNLKLDD